MVDHMAGLVQRARVLGRRGTIGVCLLGLAAPFGALACRASEERGEAAASAERAAGDTVPVATPAAVAPSPAAQPTANTAAGEVARAAPASADTAARPRVARERVRRQPAAARDTTRRDTARRATVRRDTVRRDTVRRDTTARATATRDTSARDSTTATTQQGQGGGGDKLAVTQDEYQGWKWFAVNCTRCHGEDAIGSALAPSLVKSFAGGLTHEMFVQTVKKGRPEKGMPPWEGLLTDEQIEQIHAYLKARGEGRLAPGRPHVKSGG